MKDDVAQRLQIARKAAGFSDAAEAAKAMGVPYPTYAAHENAWRGFRPAAASKYARRFHVSLDWLLEGRGDGPSAKSKSRGVARNVRVIGNVQAGAWAETWELPLDEQQEVTVTDRAGLTGHRLYAAEIRGPSMNRKWEEGTIVVFTKASETGEDIQVGKRYIVERERSDGMREATVKKVWRDETGKFWLVPESDDPRYQEPIPIGGSEGETVQIVGRVRYAVSVE